MAKINNIKQWISEGNLVLYTGAMLAFSMPFGKAFVPPFIGLFLLSLIISPGFGKIKNRSKFQWLLLLPSLFYLWYVLGLLWSSNLDFGLKDLEIKASLFLIPFVLFFSNWDYFNKKLIVRYIIAFFLGCLSSVLISAIHSFYFLISANDTYAFFYERSSYFMHTSYISMYIIFALTGLYLIRNEILRVKWYCYFSAMILVFYLNLFSSKAGMITFIISILFVLIDILFIRKKYKDLLLFFLIPVMFFVGSMFVYSDSSTRIEAAVNTFNQNTTEMLASGESTADRILIWKAALNIVKEHPILGTGIGDVKDELIKTYVEHGLTYPAQLKLNAHNQFLQSLVAMGIPAMIILIGIFLIPFWYSFKRKAWLYFMFICFFAFNILVESMLEVQAGIVFFAFWNSLFWVMISKKDDSFSL